MGGAATRARRRARRAAGRAVRSLLERGGRYRLAHLDRERVVERWYHSPIPEWERLPDAVWSRRHPMPGVAWDPAPGLTLLEGPLRPLLAEFAPPPIPGTTAAERAALLVFYDGLDGATWHALLRHVRPRRVVELGSGVSTLIGAAALARNAAEGDPAELRVFDPFPRAPTEAGLGDHGRLERTAAEQVPLEVFDELGAGDVLFVDTTHVVTTGGDVVRIVLEVLPRLAPGVLVHVHDILLPYEYHRMWFESGWYWNEQYLLHAFLVGNPEWELVLANHHLHREHEPRLRAVTAAYEPAKQPSALWLRRRIPGEQGPLAERLRAR
ncbi:class I SAM-dependent methyltransferase [Patulibacter defluvii]|uniref:class I SAM-dependent methyltransferase n=1 Tax=Patulibacter defluvii TaxID=3095358 RepID=UPI002A74E67B|nr:class I SAM-dependent methyltransferase [Patulibacter sp. DM4]